MEREIIIRHLQGMCQAQSELLGEGEPASCKRPMAYAHVVHIPSPGPAWDCVGQHNTLLG